MDWISSSSCPHVPAQYICKRDFSSYFNSFQFQNCPSSFSFCGPTSTFYFNHVVYLHPSEVSLCTLDPLRQPFITYSLLICFPLAFPEGTVAHSLPTLTHNCKFLPFWSFCNTTQPMGTLIAISRLKIVWVQDMKQHFQNLTHEKEPNCGLSSCIF